MKKVFCIFLSCIFLIDSLCLSLFAEPMSIANPTDTKEIFTAEELIALILSSDVSYRIKGKTALMEEEEVYTGTVTPVLDSFDSEEYTNEAGYLPFRFPIPEFSQANPVLPSEFSLVFHFPFVVKQLSELSCFVVPFVCYTGSTQNTPKYFDCSLLYQLESDSIVIDSLSLNASFNSISSFTFSSGFSARIPQSGSKTVPNGINFPIKDKSWGDSLVSYGSIISTPLLKSWVLLNGRSNDIDSWGFTWTPSDPSGNGFPYNFVGIGFCFSPMAITYISGGGYVPGGSGGGDIDPDPDNPGGGGSGSGVDYSAQLDKLYDELVKQGLIQQEQNNAIIEGQKEIKDALINPTPEQSQEAEERQEAITSMLEEFESIQSELDIDKPALTDDYDFTDEPWWSDSVDDIKSIFDLFNHFKWLTLILVAVSGIIIIRLILYGTSG